MPMRLARSITLPEWWWIPAVVVVTLLLLPWYVRYWGLVTGEALLMRTP